MTKFKLILWQIYLNKTFSKVLLGWLFGVKHSNL